MVVVRHGIRHAAGHENPEGRLATRMRELRSLHDHDDLIHTGGGLCSIRTKPGELNFDVRVALGPRKCVIIRVGRVYALHGAVLRQGDDRFRVGAVRTVVASGIVDVGVQDERIGRFLHVGLW